MSQNSQPCRHTPRLQIDRIGCLGIGFEGNHIASTGRRVNDEFTETTVKTEQELSVLRLVDEPADASISCEFEVRQYIVELQPGHGLALAEIEAIINEADLTGWQEVFENPELGGRQNHFGAVGSATRSEGQPEVLPRQESSSQTGNHGKRSAAKPQPKAWLDIAPQNRLGLEIPHQFPRSNYEVLFAAFWLTRLWRVAWL